MVSAISYFYNYKFANFADYQLNFNNKTVRKNKQRMKNVLEVMNNLKEKGLIKDYAIGGAIANLRWTEPFFTRDLDIFVIPEKEVAENEILVLNDRYDYLKGSTL
jgi:predicted nucleotidyltransferase